jgi:tetratricopeptide (TPR) repeat protein
VKKRTIVGMTIGLALILFAALLWPVRSDLPSANNEESNLGAAYRSVLVDGDLAGARPYVKRALDLITPENIERGPRGTLWLMSFPAYDALLAADPETALFEAKNRLWDTLEGEPGAAPRNIASSMLGAIYLTLGNISLARDWFEQVYTGERLRQYFLAAIAYMEDDHEEMTKHLEQMLITPMSRQGTIRTTPAWAGARSLYGGFPRSAGMRCCTALLLARGGFLSEAEEVLSNKTQGFEIQRGVLALSRGSRVEGMRVLEDALSLFRPPEKMAQLAEAAMDRRDKERIVMEAQKDSAAVYFMGSEILAEAFREQGQFGKAVQVLEGALEKQILLLVDQSSPLTGGLWLRIQAQLAQVYREMGRDGDARKIEDTLRRRLALADPDHPILRQLERTSIEH